MNSNDLLWWQILMVTSIGAGSLIGVLIVGKVLGYAIHSGWAKFDEVQKRKKERQQ